MQKTRPWIGCKSSSAAKRGAAATAAPLQGSGLPPRAQLHARTRHKAQSRRSGAEEHSPPHAPLRFERARPFLSRPREGIGRRGAGALLPVFPLAGCSDGQLRGSTSVNWGKAEGGGAGMRSPEGLAEPGLRQSRRFARRGL